MRLGSPASTALPARTRLPGPRRSIPWIGEGIAYSRDPIRFLARMVDEHGEIVGFTLAGMRFVLISGPAALQQVLVRNHEKYRKGPVLEGITEALGEGLLTAEGETWRKHRKNAQPAFHRAAIEAYPADIRAFTSRMLEAWQGRGSALALEEMLALTLKIAVKCFFGSTLESRAEELGRAFAEITDFFEHSITPLGRISLQLPTPRRRRYLEAVRVLDDALIGLIRTRMDGGEPGADLLGHLIEAQLSSQGRFEYGSIRDDLMTLFIAGHETSAVALAFTLHRLACRPDLQQAIRSEGRGGQTLKNCILESLRLHPPVWTLGREAVAEDVIDGYPIAPGTLILVPTWAIHRNPLIFTAPETFDPGRWNATPRESLEPGRYLPFGMGRRSCIGEGFALMQMEEVIAEVLSRFSLRVPADSREPELTGTLTLRPRDDLPLLLSEVSA